MIGSPTQSILAPVFKVSFIIEGYTLGVDRVPLGRPEDDRLAIDKEVLRVVCTDEDRHHLRVVLGEISGQDRRPVVEVGAGEPTVTVRSLDEVHKRVRAIV